jgi:hypothetical protein
MFFFFFGDDTLDGFGEMEDKANTCSKQQKNTFEKKTGNKNKEQNQIALISSASLAPNTPKSESTGA